MCRPRGVEVDTQGDAFFVAFPTAPGALEAARAITQGLAAGPIRLRVGLHTGTPLVTDEGYVGEDVHRALAQRVLSDERLELRHEIVVATQCNVGVHAILQRAES